MLKIIKSEGCVKTVIGFLNFAAYAGLSPVLTCCRLIWAGCRQQLPLVVAIPVLLLPACGNKGDLYIPVDQQTLEELEQVEKELEEAAKKKRGNP